MGKAFFSILLIYSIIFSGKLLSFEVYSVSDYQSQLYKEVSELEFGADKEGSPIYYKVQTSNNRYLYLGPNEVFFTPIGVLTLGDEQNNSGLGLNQQKEFGSIRGFNRVNDQLEWSFITTVIGDIHTDCIISATSKEIGTTFLVQIDDGNPISVVITDAMVSSGNMEFTFFDIKEGLHTFKIKLVKTQNKNALKMLNVRLSGCPVVNGYVVRERWRPEAVYSSWKSSKNPIDVQAWIMELTTESEFSHFSPLTTEFGYYGPIFKQNGLVSGMNMSIWSSSASEELLPISMQSHLLGIGSSVGEFSKWDSPEGTGVKVKNWNIFDNNTSKKYVIGLRYSNDGAFRTFYSYFWNEGTNKWQLYTVGRKYDQRPLEKLKTNAFIEVPGAAFKERSNHKVREINYRGFVCDSDGQWFDLDQSFLPKYSTITNHRRGITEDGQYFFASTGGLQNTKQEEKTIQKSEIVNRPIYMCPNKLEGFFTLPFIPEIKNITLSSNNECTVEFLTNTSLSSNVTLCWGAGDALSVQENWTGSYTFSLAAGPSDLIHSVNLPASADTKFFRILVKDATAQMWSFETYFLDEIVK